MPVSTEVLNDDIKELRADIHKLAVGLGELRTEVRDAIAFGKWGGTALVGVLIAMGSSGFWWAGRIDSDVRNMGVRYDDRFKTIDARFDKLEAKVDARFDKLEAAIAKLAEQARPVASATPGPAR